jgi:hypothetical protein
MSDYWTATLDEPLTNDARHPCAIPGCLNVIYFGKMSRLTEGRSQIYGVVYESNIPHDDFLTYYISFTELFLLAGDSIDI